MNDTKGGNPSTGTDADYVPLVDLRLGKPADPVHRRELVRTAASACATSGFLVVSGHGVPETTIDELRRVSRAFFGLPDSVKRAVASEPADTRQHGYHGYDMMQNFTASRLDESVTSGRPETTTANLWPRLPGFREACLAYYAAASAVSCEVMRLLAEALGLPIGWFDDKFDRHQTPLALNYYPALPDTAPTEVVVRHDPHADFGTITLLHQDGALGWLQIQHQDGRWLDLAPRPGTFVVNLGRLMTRWTNDRWPSTVHRVITPPDQLEHDRISIAFFYQPNADALISCIPSCADESHPARYPDTTAGADLRTRLRRVFLEQVKQETARSVARPAAPER